MNPSSLKHFIKQIEVSFLHVYIYIYKIKKHICNFGKNLVARKLPVLEIGSSDKERRFREFSKRQRLDSLERVRDSNGSGAVVRFGGERAEWERFIYLFI